MSAGAFVHLTSSTPAREHVEELLAKLDRKERVLELPDEMPNEGPLHDIDTDGQSRAAWRRRILGAEAEALPPGDFDDAPLWRSIVADDANVVLWHGPHPAERILSLRGCWHLRDHAHRVHEVAFRTKARSWPSGESRPEFYDSVSLASADDLARGLASCVRVSAEEVARRAARWESVRDVPGDWIHHIDGEDFVRRPVTVYDDALVEACRSEWTRARLVVARVLAENPSGLWVLSWRIRVLVEAGALESRADETDAAFPEQLRARSR
ncbi:MAG: DUF1835 domain-containing protein [Labilithrix sp.]|nr:DUF1835 domain-containing protein [Labilithrix sp.]